MSAATASHQPIDISLFLLQQLPQVTKNGRGWPQNVNHQRQNGH